MGGAGAQVARFADIARTCKDAIEARKVALLVNMGDTKAVGRTLSAELRAAGIPWTMHSDWDETRAFIEDAHRFARPWVHVFLHDALYAAVYATNLLMRVADVMITKPSELSFYPCRSSLSSAWEGMRRGARSGAPRSATGR
jgi:hypothetical protein